ncbi:MAG: RlmE family RNA methyltransferase [Alphaproteobacteria bacterium]|nr:RlmE family RNA methyltransferase [Alphaproteobacteria bacterium]
MPRGKSGGTGSDGGSRRKTVRVRTARGRKLSSTRWLQRQLNDPYVQEAQRLGYRSRSAFKLIQLNEKFEFLKPGARVVDLGAAPGGWAQVSVAAGAMVVGIDVQEIEPLEGATLMVGDIYDDDIPARLREALDGPADVVMSDMAAPSTGHAGTDHLRVMALIEAAYDVAQDLLKPGGIFVGKVLQGGTERDLLQLLKRDFTKVSHAKPAASRADSSELYIVAQGFRGGDTEK